MAKTASSLLLFIFLPCVGTFNVTFDPPVMPLISFWETRNITVSVTELDQPIRITAESSDTVIFFIVGENEFFITPRNGSEVNTFTVGIETSFLGLEQIDFTVQTQNAFLPPVYFIEPYNVRVGIPSRTIKIIASYVILVWLIISYITMGAKVKWSVLKPKLCRPRGIIIGVLCQFMIMPVMAFALSKMLSLEPTDAIGIIIVGSCPGGWLSNVFSALLDCDLVLSLAMTFFSTIVAVGFMPLNMFIYATPYTGIDENLQTPFWDIFLQLLSLVIPVFIGVFISNKYPKVGEKLQKMVKPFAVGIIVVATILGAPAIWYVLYSPVAVWMAAGALPFIGCVLGLLFAKMTCLPNRSAVTVSLETGCQNSLLALSIGTLSYSEPQSDLIGRPAALVSIFTLIQGAIVVFLYTLMTKYPGKSDVPDEDEIPMFKKTKVGVVNEAQSIAIQTEVPKIQPKWEYGKNTLPSISKNGPLAKTENTDKEKLVNDKEKELNNFFNV